MCVCVCVCVYVCVCVCVCVLCISMGKKCSRDFIARYIYSMLTSGAMSVLLSELCMSLVDCFITEKGYPGSWEVFVCRTAECTWAALWRLCDH